MTGKRWVVFFILLMAFAKPVCAENGERRTVTFQRPKAPDGGPTKVYVTMIVMDIDEINSANQNFKANIFLTAYWHDPQLVHDGPGKRVLPLKEVWHPQLQFVNQQKIWLTLPEDVYVFPDGRVEYDQRVWGPFSQPLDVHDFPFDTQDFAVRIAAGQHSPEEVIFESSPEIPSGLAPEFSLPDWEVLDWKLDFTPYQPIGPKFKSASFTLVLEARRYAYHYLLKVILPLVMIVIMSWIVFWIDPKESGTQIGVATTSMLTLIAYRFMVGGQIPIVPYLTRMDYFIFGSTILVFASLVQSVLTSIMVRRNHRKLALRFDFWCRFLFPGTFIAIFVFSLFK